MEYLRKFKSNLRIYRDTVDIILRQRGSCANIVCFKCPFLASKYLTFPKGCQHFTNDLAVEAGLKPLIPIPDTSSSLRLELIIKFYLRGKQLELDL